MALNFRLFNTLSRRAEPVTPLRDTEVRLYSCGPTVYDFVHIGNFRTYIFEDTLRRALAYAGFSVIHASNITDVGHLVGDEDAGEDKLEVGAVREGKDPLAIARVYEEHYWHDAAKLNILPPDKVLRATECISGEIALVEELLQKGYAYSTEEAIYFDTAKWPEYGAFGSQRAEERLTGARETVVTDPNKKNPADFALWFFIAGRHAGHILRWPSPWGDGFPGWHIECSAISRELLGQPFDIHAGGEDLIPVHHTNEIAQSEAAYGKPFARQFIHGGFLKVDGKRMGKSLGNAYTLADLATQGFDPIAFRYFTFTAHYRQPLNFTWSALEGAANAYTKLLDLLYELKISTADGPADTAPHDQRFADAVTDDLAMPEALVVVWALVKDTSLSPAARFHTITENYDRVLGLSLAQKVSERADIPDEIREKSVAREDARGEKDWARADFLREEILAAGYDLRDTDAGPLILKR